jgi:hypothetical protein
MMSNENQSTISASDPTALMQSLASDPKAAHYLQHKKSIFNQLRWILNLEPYNKHTELVAEVLSAYACLDSEDNGYTIEDSEELYVIGSTRLKGGEGFETAWISLQLGRDFRNEHIIYKSPVIQGTLEKAKLAFVEDVRMKARSVIERVNGQLSALTSEPRKDEHM